MARLSDTSGMGDYGKVPVLVTNDDGIFAPGLTELVLKLAEICEVCSLAACQFSRL